MGKVEREPKRFVAAERQVDPFDHIIIAFDLNNLPSKIKGQEQKYAIINTISQWDRTWGDSCHKNYLNCDEITRDKGEKVHAYRIFNEETGEELVRISRIKDNKTSTEYRLRLKRKGRILSLGYTEQKKGGKKMKRKDFFIGWEDDDDEER